MGAASLDDAGVMELTPELALVQTVDFFTPVVDEPEDFGFIAVMNALSDIYAMGAEPLCAMAVCGFPKDVLPLSVLARIFQGALAALEQEGVVLLGGHTVRSPELTYGLAVTGTVHPKAFKAKSGAQPGDALILTKPLGTGVLSTLLKRKQLPPEFLGTFLGSMKTSSRKASKVLREVAHALTDVTGFGLLGHAWELARASGVSVEIQVEKVPLLPGAWEAAEAKAIPGGLLANWEWVKPRLSDGEAVPQTLALLLCDPQTSGGLLAAIPQGSVASVLQQLPSAAVIGTVLPGPERLLHLTMDARRQP